LLEADIYQQLLDNHQAFQEKNPDIDWMARIRNYFEVNKNLLGRMNIDDRLPYLIAINLEQEPPLGFHTNNLFGLERLLFHDQKIIPPSLNSYEMPPKRIEVPRGIHLIELRDDILDLCSRADKPTFDLGACTSLFVWLNLMKGDKPPDEDDRVLEQIKVESIALKAANILYKPNTVELSQEDEAVLFKNRRNYSTFNSYIKRTLKYAHLSDRGPANFLDFAWQKLKSVPKDKDLDEEIDSFCSWFSIITTARGPWLGYLKQRLLIDLKANNDLSEYNMIFSEAAIVEEFNRTHSESETAHINVVADPLNQFPVVLTVKPKSNFPDGRFIMPISPRDPDSLLPLPNIGITDIQKVHIAASENDIRLNTRVQAILDRLDQLKISYSFFDRSTGSVNACLTNYPGLVSSTPITKEQCQDLTLTKFREYVMKYVGVLIQSMNKRELKQVLGIKTLTQDGVVA